MWNSLYCNRLSCSHAIQTLSSSRCATDEQGEGCVHTTVSFNKDVRYRYMYMLMLKCYRYLAVCALLLFSLLSKPVIDTGA